MFWRVQRPLRVWHQPGTLKTQLGGAPEVGSVKSLGIPVPGGPGLGIPTPWSPLPSEGLLVAALPSQRFLPPNEQLVINKQQMPRVRSVLQAPCAGHNHVLCAFSMCSDIHVQAPCAASVMGPVGAGV